MHQQPQPWAVVCAASASFLRGDAAESGEIIDWGVYVCFYLWMNFWLTISEVATVEYFTQRSALNI